VPINNPLVPIDNRRQCGLSKVATVADQQPCCASRQNWTAEVRSGSMLSKNIDSAAPSSSSILVSEPELGAASF
jgi:hypothetical protein